MYLYCILQTFNIKCRRHAESKTSKALNDTLIYIDPIVTKARKLQDCYDEEQKALKNLTMVKRQTLRSMGRI
ncbi:hypothetical protein KM043_018589 [Ampulex compressa]|nr:hypothetical protein KM043_018589 [Ampulex compressa]